MGRVPRHAHHAGRDRCGRDPGRIRHPGRRLPGARDRRGLGAPASLPDPDGGRLRVLNTLPIVFVLAGLVFYVVLGGADFGAGLWQLLAGRGAPAQRIRDHAHHAMGPVWEANHVWLIFVLTVLWTGYPTVFASIASTLSIPFFVAAIGIILRGGAYALRPGTRTAREHRLHRALLGMTVGASAGGRVP